ncbi:class I SAM-dependent methyltransferase [Streptomyces sp. NBC_00569]|uniref:class I SAM-dependent methyltransferase n=1 Tax=unclassified Streptomyces TaxID=2593676 RepID=UPI00225C0950|nr:MULTISPECIES: class I SAM-dependent methyltransferase [unclassified Streptomyces]MCX5439085.1 class I SAM-dependent methyltransferase [Streptomyces sp. NBC_00063]WUB94420.1 class I SAM-dependent methyltransferase [Streptomyces sp. NBC_00569]
MPFDHNDHYHRLLLRRLPKDGRTALDIGCGTGRFARRLAGRGYEVDALDPSAEVIAEAEAGGGGPRFRRADVTATDLPEGHYDVITCLASLHHMPFATVTRLRAALAPGGALLVLGCYAGVTPLDLVAVPANAAARAAVHVADRRRGAAPPPLKAPVRRPDMTLAAVRTEAGRLLPGSQVRQLVFWRYLLTYHA